MKGKIFKRLASAMLGLMFAVTAVEMKGFAAEELAADEATATISLTNFSNDGVEEDDKLRVDVHVKLDANAEENRGKGKIIKITDWDFSFLVPAADINNDSDTDIYFTRAVGVDGMEGNSGVYSDNTIGYKYYTTNSPKGVQEMIFPEGTEINLGTMQVTLKRDKADGDKLKFADNKNIEATFENSKTGKEANIADVKDIEFTLCAHETEGKVTYTDINAETHTLVCGDCDAHVVQKHEGTGNEKSATADADKLGGSWQKCKCGLEIYKNLTRQAGTTPRFMPNGTTAISGYQGLNFVVVDINGYKVMVQDALNEFGGKKMTLTATEAAADSAVRKNIESKISKDGKVYTFAITADGTAVKSEDIKDSIRVLYQLPEGVAFGEYVNLLKDAGVTGDFAPEVEKVNDKEYVVVCTKTVGPYVLPNGVTTTTAENKSTTSTSGKSAKTGDATGMVCLAASGLMIVAGLYMELMKKKKNA